MSFAKLKLDGGVHPLDHWISVDKGVQSRVTIIARNAVGCGARVEKSVDVPL